MNWLQRLWAHDRFIPILGVVVMALGLPIAYYSATKPAQPPVVVMPSASTTVPASISQSAKIYVAIFTNGERGVKNIYFVFYCCTSVVPK